MKSPALLALLLALPALHVRAELALPPVFTDNAVLQRDTPLPVWGQSEPGQRVTVRFAGESETTTADAAGHWHVTLAPLAASFAPRTLEIAADTVCRRTNVLVGDVWLAAGQSNMEFPLARETHAAAELPAATNSRLRLLNFAFAGQSSPGLAFDSATVARLTPELFFSGAWQPCTPAAARRFSAIAYYFGREIQTREQVPVGLIHCAVGGSPAEAWISRAALAREPQLAAMVHGNWLTNSALDDWCRQRARENLATARTNRPAPPGDDLGPSHAFQPGFLWSAGPARLAPFALRGVLWYQGESNSLEERRVRQHELLFPLLVREWRSAWNQPLPWLYCQLASIRTNHYASAAWPEFRDQQRRLLAVIPAAAMAVTSDHGLPDDVHPREKREIGRRLALLARHQVYGEAVECDGPQPLRAEVHGGRVTVQFTHAKGLATADGQSPRSFEVAGADGVFQPVSAKLVGNTVDLDTAQISPPRQLRYGWQPYSEGNLINAAALPASTFQIPVVSP